MQYLPFEGIQLSFLGKETVGLSVSANYVSCKCIYLYFLITAQHENQQYYHNRGGTSSSEDICSIVSGLLGAVDTFK